ncbi:MAG: hypothetical protein NXH90_12845 [Flavobacteriaceae bacterium]|nr:hypothetical protein [Flavobacteriaceae bacterium]
MVYYVRRFHFKATLLANYIAHSEGIDMRAYANKEKELLSQGTYGVEEYHVKVDAYIFVG